MTGQRYVMSLDFPTILGYVGIGTRAFDFGANSLSACTGRQWSHIHQNLDLFAHLVNCQSHRCSRLHLSFCTSSSIQYIASLYIWQFVFSTLHHDVVHIRSGKTKGQLFTGQQFYKPSSPLSLAKQSLSPDVTSKDIILTYARM